MENENENERCSPDIELTPEQIYLINDMINSWIDDPKQFRQAFREDCKRLLATRVRSSAGMEEESKCCRGLAPQSECQCEIERKAAGYPPYRRGGVAQSSQEQK